MLIKIEKWHQWQLIGRMLLDGWQPTARGEWSHPDGAIVDLNAPMLDGREYWHQLAERQQLPPSVPVPF